VLVLWIGSVGADDRDFLRKRAAAPNILFILDASGSMVGYTEHVFDVDDMGTPADPSDDVTTRLQGSITFQPMVPGAGDDPTSRMGIAKRVLREFLSTVDDANFALASYPDQEIPDTPETAVPRKHWAYQYLGVYNAISDDMLEYDGVADRFRLLETNYIYRVGRSQAFDGTTLVNPAFFARDVLIGYNPYFSGNEEYPVGHPLEGTPDPFYVAPENRYGPETAWELTYDPGVSAGSFAYDTLPIYFGTCVTDDNGTPSDPFDDEEVCSSEGIFPVYSSGLRDIDGSLILHDWLYSYDPMEEQISRRCDPTDLTVWDRVNNVTFAPFPDGIADPDACRWEWMESRFGGNRTFQWRRRVRLEIPPSGPGGPNFPLGIDSVVSRVPVGNQLLDDPAKVDPITPGDPPTVDPTQVEDYDSNPLTPNEDLDGDDINDWIMYAVEREQRNLRICDLPTPVARWTSTPTNTPTATPTQTPTPVPANCGDITVTNLRPDDRGRLERHRVPRRRHPHPVLVADPRPGHLDRLVLVRRRRHLLGRSQRQPPAR
jgi:hypothetical protein